MERNMEFKYIVEEKHNARKVADVLVAVFGISALMQKRIRLYGNLWVNGKDYRMVDLVYTNDVIIAHPSKDSRELIPAYINKVTGIEILFEDDHVLVVNKPSDLVVHPTMSHPNQTLIDLLSDEKLHTVTRLDRETSGAMIIAKHGHAHHRISQKPIKRIYWALTHGLWLNKRGVIDAPIRRSQDSIMIRIVDQEGREALTDYKVKAQHQKMNYSWLEFQLRTGRTHQIRVHSLFNGHPLLGDGLYGLSDYYTSGGEQFLIKKIKDLDPKRIEINKQKTFRKLLSSEQIKLDLSIKRQALHAKTIGFIHPIKNEYMEFEAALPEDMDILISKTR